MPISVTNDLNQGSFVYKSNFYLELIKPINEATDGERGEAEIKRKFQAY